MPKSIKPLLFAALICICFSTVKASDRPRPPMPGPSAGFPYTLGKFAALFSNLTTVSRDDYRQFEIEFTLKDGTRIGGLFFPRRINKELDPLNFPQNIDKTPRPLLIASFGFIADRWSHSTAQFLRNIVKNNLVDANILVLDAASSGPFYAMNNHVISMGAYDEGRIFVDVASQMKAAGVRGYISGTHWGYNSIPPFSTIHLLGVSMSGTGVVHGLLEDSRLSKEFGQEKLFRSGIIFSAVTDISVQPGRTYSGFSNKQLDNNVWGTTGFGPAKDWITLLGAKVIFGHFEDMVSDFEQKHFEILNKGETLGDFMYRSMQRRLVQLGRISKRDPTWNPRIQVRSPEAYAASCDLDNFIHDVDTPLVIVHSVDDSVVPYDSHQRIVYYSKENGVANDNIIPLNLKQGGHWGYTKAYGKQWLADVINWVVFKPNEPVPVKDTPLPENEDDIKNIPIIKK